MSIISGDKVIRILAEKYERKPVLIFATIENTKRGDILFQTGNGLNQQPSILRVQEIPMIGSQKGDSKYFTVCHIFPKWCTVCPDECGHPSIVQDGEVLTTDIIE